MTSVPNSLTHVVQRVAVTMFTVQKFIECQAVEEDTTLSKTPKIVPPVGRCFSPIRNSSRDSKLTNSFGALGVG